MENDSHRTVHGRGFSILKGKRHIVFVAVVLLIVALVILHVAFANSIYKASGFSLKSPYSYWMMGGLLVVVAFKLFYFWRFKNSIGRHFKK
jgi:hypothetical protein